MRRYKADFTLIKRANGYWYYRLGSDTKRTARNTGETSKGEAARWVKEHVFGSVTGGRERVAPSLRDWALHAWDGYVEFRESRNKTLTPLYVKRRRQIIAAHIIPDPIAEKVMTAITRGDVEEYETRLLRRHP